MQISGVVSNVWFTSCSFRRCCSARSRCRRHPFTMPVGSRRSAWRSPSRECWCRRLRNRCSACRVLSVRISFQHVCRTRGREPPWRRRRRRADQHADRHPRSRPSTSQLSPCLRANMARASGVSWRAIRSLLPALGESRGILRASRCPRFPPDARVAFVRGAAARIACSRRRTKR
jgi:hypothetical protein